MKKKYIIYSIIGIGILYLISLKIYSKKISEYSGVKSNSTRIKIGLPTLNEKWKLDSICSFKNDYQKITSEPDFFENDVYMLIWTNENKLNDTHKTKEVYYEKSLLLWENRIILEIDSYTKHISKEQYAELRVSYDFLTKKRDYLIDTLKTEYAIQKEKELLKKANEKGLFICGTGMDLNIKTPIEINKNEMDKLIQNWNKK